MTGLLGKRGGRIVAGLALAGAALTPGTAAAQTGAARSAAAPVSDAPAQAAVTVSLRVVARPGVAWDSTAAVRPGGQAGPALHVVVDTLRTPDRPPVRRVTIWTE